MSWHETVDEVVSKVVQIETPDGFGTGFIVDRYSWWVGIATAKHVVEKAHRWNWPIKVHHPSLSTPLTFESNGRHIGLHDELDLAILGRGVEEDIAIPDAPIRVVPVGNRAMVGVAVGWLGYPQPEVVDGKLCCFFSGHISGVRGSRATGGN